MRLINLYNSCAFNVESQKIHCVKFNRCIIPFKAIKISYKFSSL